MSNKLNVVFAYSWRLASSDNDHVQRIMESVRLFCIDLGCEEVGPLLVKPDAVQFTCIVPYAGQHDFVLAYSIDTRSWSASSWQRVSSFKEISEIMEHAAEQSIDVRMMFAGMELLYRRNTLGEIEAEQRSLFDPETF